MFNLFTYGTLLKGNPNEGYLKSAKYVGDGKLPHIKLFDYVNLYHMCSHYPVALFAEKGSDLIGEVYECPDYLLPNLEKLEGTPTLYTRETCKVKMADGNEIECFVYIGNVDTWKNCNSLVPYDMSEKYRLCEYEFNEE